MKSQRVHKDVIVDAAAEGLTITLTLQQARALRAFCHPYEGETTTSEGCWMEGVRPWPTMENLCAIGLAVEDGYLNQDEGYAYKLTALGAEVLGYLRNTNAIERAAKLNSRKVYARVS